MKNAVYDAFPGVRRRGPTASRRVALTFDDGPDHLTERYLDMLDELGVPATFFLVGGRAASRPDLVREYRRRGHQIAGHGYDHKRFNKLGRRALLEQCARTESALGGQLSGRPWVRPPHGSLDASSLAIFTSAARSGFSSSRRHTMNSSTGTRVRSFKGLSRTSEIFSPAAAAGTMASPRPARTMARIEWIWLRCWT